MESTSRLRRRCLRVLDESCVELRVPFDAAEFAEQVSAARGRVLRVSATRFTAAVSGLWMIGEEIDHVAYDEAAAAVLRDAIIAHEIGHMLWRHDCAVEGHGDVALGAAGGQLFPGQSAEILRKVFGRPRSFHDPREREAEMMAVVILERARQLTQRQAAVLPERFDGELRRVCESLMSRSMSA